MRKYFSNRIVFDIFRLFGPKSWGSFFGSKTEKIEILSQIAWTLDPRFLARSPIFGKKCPWKWPKTTRQAQGVGVQCPCHLRRNLDFFGVRPKKRICRFRPKWPKNIEKYAIRKVRSRPSIFAQISREFLENGRFLGVLVDLYPDLLNPAQILSRELDPPPTSS